MRQPNSYLVSSPHRLFKNSSTAVVLAFTQFGVEFGGTEILADLPPTVIGNYIDLDSNSYRILNFIETWKRENKNVKIYSDVCAYHGPSNDTPLGQI